MRSVAEIDADIAEVQKRIASRNEGMPSRNDPTYRASRFDYIVEGDRSGLDNYQNALNAAIQNKLSREAQEKLVKLGKQQADEENMEQWQKDYTFAKSAQSEIYNNPASTQKQKDDADATVRYYEAVGAKKGYMKKYADMTKAPETPKAETPVAAPAQPAGESFKQLIAKGKTLESDEDLDKYIGDVMGYTGNDAVVREAYDAISSAQEKKKANADKRWSTFKNDVDAAIKAKDKNKLKELQGKLDGYDGQTDLPTVRQKVDAALKPPKKDNLVDLVYKQYSIDALSNIALSLSTGDSGKGITKPVSGGRNATFVRLSNGDLEVRDEKGNKVGIIPKSKLKADLNASKNTPITKVAPKKPKNQVETVLTSGKDSVEILPIKGEIW